MFSNHQLSLMLIFSKNRAERLMTFGQNQIEIQTFLVSSCQTSYKLEKTKQQSNSRRLKFDFNKRQAKQPKRYKFRYSKAICNESDKKAYKLKANYLIGKNPISRVGF